MQPFRYIQSGKDNQWHPVTNDEMGRVFQGLTITPRKTIIKYIPEFIDNSHASVTKRDRFLKYRNPQTGTVIGEPGLESVHPEFDAILLGPLIKPIVRQIGNRVINSEFLQNRLFIDNKNALGEFIGDGSESTVFLNKRNPKEVLKVYEGTNQKTVADAKQFADKTVRLRNSAPQVPIRRYGYIRQDGKIKPIFAQKRLNNLVDPEIMWNDPKWIQYQKQLDDLFHRNGWTGNGTYTKGSLTASDVQPGNIGFYENGEIAPFDIYVE